MKKLIAAIALASVASFAGEAPDSVKVRPALPEFHVGAKLDSVIKAEKECWKADSAKYAGFAKKDSAKFAEATAKLPDSIRTEIKKHRTEIEAKVAEFQKLKGAEIKVKLDSLHAIQKVRRDSVIAKLPVEVQEKIKAHVAEIDAKRTEVKARVEAKRADIEKRIEAAKAAKAAKEAAAATTTTTTTP
ncbi:MAG: hypothetical protein RL318_2086 [Fibrobacterota bacterium]|jgi:ABC-type phosphate transport system auxiliary subunit